MWLRAHIYNILEERSLISSEHRAIRRLFHLNDEVDLLFVIGITGYAMYMAWTCNKRSGNHNPWVAVAIAAVFPEFYILQASARNLVGEGYSCRKR